MIGVRKLSPGGYEYLTGAVACGDAGLQAGESLSDYYVRSGYPPGEWIGAGAAVFGVEGTQVTAAQMNALLGEGRHPNADQIQADALTAGATPRNAIAATALGRRFPRYDGIDEVREQVIDAYRAHNRAHGHPPGAAIDDTTRAAIRTRIQRNAYAQAHDGQAPAGDAQLHQWLATQQRQLKNAVSGMELIFAPPKSVSTAWALGDTRTRELIETLHDQATRDALRYFEANAAFTRKGTGGIAQHDIVGITAAMFRHWDSRAGDPHLHTHVVVSAKVQALEATGDRPETRAWTSLDGRTVLAGAVSVSEYYDSRLRDLLREHGARWVQRSGRGADSRHAIWELDGIPNELLAGFSRRALAVEHDRTRRIAEFRRDHGHEPTPKDLLELGRQAAYSTRAAKKPPRALGEHLRRWREQAVTMVPSKVIDQLPVRVLSGGPETVARADLGRLAAATRAVVSDQYSHFNRWNLEAEAHRQSAHLRLEPGARESLVTAITDTIIGATDTITLQLGSLVPEPAALRRRDGESVFVAHHSQRWTTRQTLAEEADLVRWGTRYNGVRLDPATVRAALRKEPRLNDGQRAAVIGFARSGARIQQLIAPAGTGKTTMMRVFADAWRAEGGRVYAFGPSARAAAELGVAINATPHTLHQVTAALDRGDAGRFFGFRRGDVLLVDEVAMAGTHTLHRVMKYALECGADVRWTGDDHQLAAVEAGGAVRLFNQQNGSLRLSDVVRFADKEQAHASLLIRDGDTAGLDYHFANRRVLGGSRETMRVRAERAWRADLRAGNQTLLIVSSNDDVLMANLQARDMRINAGQVGTGTEVALRDGSHASPGDWIVTRDNNRLNGLFGGKDFVKNGDVWTVVAVRPDGSVKARHRINGGQVVLEADYVRAHVELAYATTINRAQGMSVNGSAHAVIPQRLSREQFYTMVTRAKYANWLYVETHQHTIDSHQETPLDRSAREALVGVLDRTTAKTSATEELRSRLAARGSLATLVRQHNHVALLGTEARVEAALTAHAAFTEGAPAQPALRQTLITAEALGLDSTALLATCVAERELDSAEDPTAVLQWRVETALRTGKPSQRHTPTPPAQTLAGWRATITSHDPTAAVTSLAWDPVWQTAANALADGIDVERLIGNVAAALVDPARTSPEQRTVSGGSSSRTAALSPEPFHEHLTTAVTAEHVAGRVWTPHVPWQARPDFTAINTDLRNYLVALNIAIADRTNDLLLTISQDPPSWTARLGTRPTDPDAALRWDHAITHAAAYRDTFTITTNDPDYPLGPRPEGASMRIRTWRSIVARWDRDTVLTDPDQTTQTADTTTKSAVNLQDDRTTTSSRLDGLQVDRNTGCDVEPDADTQSAPITSVKIADKQTHRDAARAVPAAPESLDGLAVLTARWNQVADEIHDHDRDQRVRVAFARHAPAAAALANDPNIQNALAVAEAAGHRAEEIITQAAGPRSSNDAERLTVLMRWRLENLPTAPPRSSTSELTNTTRSPAETSPPLPWLRPVNQALADAHHDHAAELDRIATAIRTRHTQLATTARHEQPWTSTLGARPRDPADVQHWDQLITTVAAYRETYHVTSNEPLGPNPRTTGAQQAAWTQLHDDWTTTASTTARRRATQTALDRLRAELAQHADPGGRSTVDLPLDDYDLDAYLDTNLDQTLGDSHLDAHVGYDEQYWDDYDDDFDIHEEQGLGY